MSEVILFVPRAAVDASQKVADFVALARDRLTALVPAAQWNDDVWDVSSSFVRKGKNNVISRLHFFHYNFFPPR